ncbi:MAG: hypothetical protein ACUVXD_00835 [Thermodesulfobacteriota bacterium]
MGIPGNLLTTAMAVMPHTDVDRAMTIAMSLDIPFWPQLPHLTYYEDMYVQASEHFPGIELDLAHRKLRFSRERFIAEFEDTLSHLDEPDFLDISETYSVVYHRFLGLDLSQRVAIRGQMEGPISLGFNIPDQDGRPILFDDTVRPFMLDFTAKRATVQLRRLKGRNPNAFMYIDEPGLQFLFSAMAGYGDQAARLDMEYFFSMIERPRGVHLCGNPDWDFLLGLDLDILSLDVYNNGEIFASYAGSIRRFFDRGGVLVWGIVPTNFEPFSREDLQGLQRRLYDIWDALARRGIDREMILSRGLLSPATCCLVNPDRERTVEQAFGVVRRLSEEMRERHDLG